MAFWLTRDLDGDCCRLWANSPPAMKHGEIDFGTLRDSWLVVSLTAELCVATFSIVPQPGECLELWAVKRIADHGISIAGISADGNDWIVGIDPAQPGADKTLHYRFKPGPSEVSDVISREEAKRLQTGGISPFVTLEKSPCEKCGGTCQIYSDLQARHYPCPLCAEQL